MKLRIASDFHLEFYEYRHAGNTGISLHRETNEQIPLPIMEGEKEQVLILAGDIIASKKINQITNKHPMDEFFDGISNRFYKIIIDAGNHEHYGSDIDASYTALRKYYARWPNIIFLEDETTTIDDVVFFGSTFWTNFDYNPQAELYARQAMADFQYIQYKGRIFTTQDSVQRNLTSAFFLNKFFKDYPTGKRVIITHHSPSKQSCSPKFKGSMLNPAFHNNLDDFIIDEKPTLWIHGHTHESMDYMIEDTRIICNPYGYYRENIRGYQHKLVVDI